MISNISGMNILAVLAASIVYFLFINFNRDIKKANYEFMKLSIILLIISFIPLLILPFYGDTKNVGSISWSTIFNLMLMHIVTAFFVIRTFVYRNKFVN